MMGAEDGPETRSRVRLLAADSALLQAIPSESFVSELF